MRPKSLLKEARKRLKRKRKRLDPEVMASVGRSIEELRTALRQRDRAQINKHAASLRNKVRSFLRKSAAQVVWEYVWSFGLAVLLALLVRHFVIEPYKIPTGSMQPTLSGDIRNSAGRRTRIGDFILVNKLAYGPTIPFTSIKPFWRGQPQRWDIVVFTTRGIPKASQYPRNFVKRIVGLPGERLEIRDGQLYVDEEPVEMPPEMKARGIRYHNAKPEQLARIDYYRYRINLFGYYHWFAIRSSHSYEDFGTWEYGLPSQEFGVPEGCYFVLGDNSGHSYDSRGWGFVPYENIRGRVIAVWWPPRSIRGVR